MENLCIKCKKNLIKIKKRKLCSNCYVSLWRKTRDKGFNLDGVPVSLETKIYHREMEFVKNYFTHNNWLYSPATFNVNGSRYTPDFYDSERNVFIEIAGTRQAFHKNKDKYKEFIKTFPKLHFEIRNVQGEIMDVFADKQARRTFSNKK